MRERASTPTRAFRPTIGAAFLCAAFVLFGLGSYFTAARAEAQSPQIVAGQIKNGTANAPAASVANLSVTLFQMGASGPLTQTAQTDAAGRFSFGDLQLASGTPVFASVDYQGIHYFSEVLTPDVIASAPISLTIYETGPMPADFQIDRAHLILEVGQKLLNGIELVQLKNPTDRVFLMPLPLPANVASVQFNDPRDEFRAVRGSDGSISYPVLPSTEQVLLGVQIQTRSSDYALKIDTPVRIGELNVLVPQNDGVQAVSTQLKTGQPFSPQPGTTFTQLNGANIPAHSSVVVQISNLPGAESPDLARNVVLGAGSLAALALLGAGLRRRRGEPNPAFAPRPVERLERLKAIAALDDSFEAGSIDADEYVAQRAALKAELLRVGPAPVESVTPEQGQAPEPPGEVRATTINDSDA